MVPAVQVVLLVVTSIIAIIVLRHLGITRASVVAAVARNIAAGWVIPAQSTHARDTGALTHRPVAVVHKLSCCTSHEGCGLFTCCYNSVLEGACVHGAVGTSVLVVVLGVPVNVGREQKATMLLSYRLKQHQAACVYQLSCQQVQRLLCTTPRPAQVATSRHAMRKVPCIKLTMGMTMKVHPAGTPSRHNRPQLRKCVGGRRHVCFSAADSNSGTCSGRLKKPCTAEHKAPAPLPDNTWHTTHNDLPRRLHQTEQKGWQWLCKCRAAGSPSAHCQTLE